MKNNTMKTVSRGKRGWWKGLRVLFLCLVICSLLAVAGTTLVTSPVQAAFTINDPGLLHATVGHPFSYLFTRSGTAPCASGTTIEPTGWRLSNSVWLTVVDVHSGQVSGTPTTAGTFKYTIYYDLSRKYSNGQICSEAASRHFQIEVACDGSNCGGSTGGDTTGGGAQIIIMSPPYEPPAPPTPVANPSILSFTANPTTIQPGQPVTLTWSTSNASSVAISLIGSVGTSSSTTVTPSASTSYTLTATGESGTTPASSTAAVTVRPWDPPTINLGKSTIQSGKSTTLAWDAPGATKVTISDAGTFGASGSTAVTPESTTTYNLKATYGDGTSQSTSATVIVEAEQPPYLLYGLIGLLALAAVAVIGYLLVKRSAARPALQSGGIQPVSTVQPAPPVSAAPTRPVLTDTSQATAVAAGTPTMVAAPPARFTLAGGGEIPLSGSARSYGRNDFKSLTSSEKSGLLSRQHMLINYDNGHYYIEDRDSTNGTKVNGEEIRGSGKRALKDGDVIDLADEIKMTFKV